MSQFPETIEVETGGPVTASVIWLHGLGADGHDFEPIVPELGLGAAGIRFIFPHAPYRPITINNGFTMRGWFDILGLTLDAPQDEAGIREAAGSLAALIERENQRGIPSERIVLAGFSQGGAIVLQCGLRYGEKLAGLLCLSCFLPLEPSFDAERTPANQQTPIFQAHGNQDPLLPMMFGTTTRDRLQAAGYQVEWRDYPMPHSVCPQEIADISAWLKRVLGC